MSPALEVGLHVLDVCYVSSQKSLFFKQSHNRLHWMWRMTGGNVTYTNTHRSVSSVFECFCAGRRRRPGSDRRGGEEEEVKENQLQVGAMFISNRG